MYADSLAWLTGTLEQNKVKMSAVKKVINVHESSENVSQVPAEPCTHHIHTEGFGCVNSKLSFYPIAV